MPHQPPPLVVLWRTRGMDWLLRALRQTQRTTSMQSSTAQADSQRASQSSRQPPNQILEGGLTDSGGTATHPPIHVGGYTDGRAGGRTQWLLLHQHTPQPTHRVLLGRLSAVPAGLRGESAGRCSLRPTAAICQDDPPDPTASQSYGGRNRTSTLRSQGWVWSMENALRNPVGPEHRLESLIFRESFILKLLLF